MTRRLAPQGSANLRAGPARGRTCGGVGLAVPRGPDRQSAALRAQLCLDCRRASPLGLRFLGFPQAPANPPLTPSGQRWAGLGAAHLGVSPQPVRVKFENRLRAPKAPEKAASSCFGGAARGCGFFFFSLPFEDCSVAGSLSGWPGFRWEFPSACKTLRRFL